MTWEGTTNVLSSEVVRHLVNGQNLEIFGSWFEGVALDSLADKEIKNSLSRSWHALKQHLANGRTDLGTALADGRQIMSSLAWVVSGALLAHDAQRDANPVAMEIARRWVFDNEGGVGEYILQEVVFASDRRQLRPKDRLNWDSRIVWGVDLPDDAAVGYRAKVSKPSGRPERLVAQM